MAAVSKSDVPGDAQILFGCILPTGMKTLLLFQSKSDQPVLTIDL